MDYWKECIQCAFEDEGITATDEQIDNVAGDVEVAYENYGLYSGHDVICKNFAEEQADKIKTLEKKSYQAESNAESLKHSNKELRVTASNRLRRIYALEECIKQLQKDGE